MWTERSITDPTVLQLTTSFKLSLSVCVMWRDADITKYTLAERNLISLDSSC